LTARTVPKKRPPSADKRHEHRERRRGERDARGRDAAERDVSGDLALHAAGFFTAMRHDELPLPAIEIGRDHRSAR
jgi:hypothetical protein